MTNYRHAKKFLSACWLLESTSGKSLLVDALVYSSRCQKDKVSLRGVRRVILKAVDLVDSVFMFGGVHVG